MGLIDQVKAGAEQATSRARESVQEAQLRHELGQAYGELGRTAFGLIEQRALDEQRLAAPAERVRTLEAQLAALIDPVETGGHGDAER